MKSVEQGTFLSEQDATSLISAISSIDADEYVQSITKKFENRYKYSDFSRMPEDKYEKFVEEDNEEFDIFLSHRSSDKDFIKKLVYFLGKKLNYTVYVDWIVDKDLKTDVVTKKNAKVIKMRLLKSKSFLLVKTKDFRKSGWIMWETGFYDGRRKNKMGQLDCGESNLERLGFLHFCKKAVLTETALFYKNKEGMIDWRKWINE